jgi:hypothetical protein
MMKRAGFLLLILFMVACFSETAKANLTVIGAATYNGNSYNLIYEDDQGLIWLDYTNPRTKWPLQVSWASGLNAPGVLTYQFNPEVSVTWDGGWRLPKTVDGARKFGNDGTTTAGCNITTSEMGHLYYISLGNLGYYDTNGKARPGWGGPKSQQEWGLKNKGPFTNLQPYSYWTGTEYSAYPIHAWDFNLYFGCQGNLAFKDAYNFSAVAVRSGKVVKK